MGLYFRHRKPFLQHDSGKRSKHLFLYFFPSFLKNYYFTYAHHTFNSGLSSKLVLILRPRSLPSLKMHYLTDGSVDGHFSRGLWELTWAKKRNRKNRKKAMIRTRSDEMAPLFSPHFHPVIASTLGLVAFSYAEITHN